MISRRVKKTGSWSAPGADEKRILVRVPVCSPRDEMSQYVVRLKNICKIRFYSGAVHKYVSILLAY